MKDFAAVGALVIKVSIIRTIKNKTRILKILASAADAYEVTAVLM